MRFLLYVLKRILHGIVSVIARRSELRFAQDKLRMLVERSRRIPTKQSHFLFERLCINQRLAGKAIINVLVRVERRSQIRKKVE